MWHVDDGYHVRHVNGIVVRATVVKSSQWYRTRQRNPDRLQVQQYRDNEVVSVTYPLEQFKLNGQRVMLRPDHKLASKYPGLGTVTDDDNAMRSDNRHYIETHGGHWWVDVKMDDGNKINVKMNDLIHADQVGNIINVLYTLSDGSTRTGVVFADSREEALIKAEHSVLSGVMDNVVSFAIKEGDVNGVSN